MKSRLSRLRASLPERFQYLLGQEDNKYDRGRQDILLVPGGLITSHNQPQSAKQRPPIGVIAPSHLMFVMPKDKGCH